MILLVVLLALGLASGLSHTMIAVPLFTKLVPTATTTVYLTIASMFLCILSFASMLGLLEGRAINGAAVNWAPVIVLIAGLVSFALFASLSLVRAYLLTRTKESGFDVRFGGAFLSSIASLCA